MEGEVGGGRDGRRERWKREEMGGDRDVREEVKAGVGKFAGLEGEAKNRRASTGSKAGRHMTPRHERHHQVRLLYSKKGEVSGPSDTQV